MNKLTQITVIASILVSYSTMAFQLTEKQELALLKREMAKLLQRIEDLEAKIDKQSLAQKTSSGEKQKVVASEKEKAHVVKVNANNNMRVYATLRPTYGYIDENNNSNFDVKDALSHAGFKAESEFKKDWTAILHGEWGIDLSNNGDFGKARQVYVAVDSPYGRIGIGKQRPVQYLFLAEYVDIFNHGASPFSYDPESLFFVNNLITYQKKINDVTFMIVGQFDGEPGDKYEDLINTGFSYDNDNLHLAVTYTDQNITENGTTIGDDTIYGGSVAYTFDSGWYIAASYQDKEYERMNMANRNGHTLDISMAYPIGTEHKLKMGYFDFDDGFTALDSQNFDGYNLTFEWIPIENLRFHLEYLNKAFDYQPDFSSISVGFRYDFSQSWKY